MSFSRLALRLAAIEALAPFSQFTATSPVWPTLATGERIFDSQIGTEPTLEQARRSATISVYTDDAKIEHAVPSLQMGEERCTLAFEIMISGVSVDDQGNAIAVAAAPTDAMAEALVDMVGGQIEAALEAARMTGLLGSVLIAIEKVESRPWRDADTDIKLSARRDEYEVRIRKSGFPGAGSGLDRLPLPFRTVAINLPEGSYGRAVAEAVAALLAAPSALPALQDMRFAGNILRETGSAAPAPVNPAATPPVGDLAASVTFEAP